MTTTEVKARAPRKQCNELTGKQWLRNSISVWSDLTKTQEEKRLKHPAMFPTALAERLIETFLRPEGEVILDPFCGSGSTLVAAANRSKRGIGIELSPDYVRLIRDRLENPEVYMASAAELLQFVSPESIDLCITSPPYWNILNQKRTADLKAVRNYDNLDGDLGTIDDYGQFLDSLVAVFAEVLIALKPGAYCCIDVMDLRKKNQFFPLHSDLAARLQQIGFIFDDLIIWNRQAEYNNLKPLGYPSVFRVNRVHEYVLVMQKPR